jgi:intracellular sulfur oxidation DsrE/DsrF family protein
LGAAASAASAALLLPAHVQGQSPSRATREPHPIDAWMAQLPGTHRLMLDAVTPFGAIEATMFAWNFLRTSSAPYGLKDQDHAVVITLRHQATVMALPQSMWDKYAGLPPKAPFENPLADDGASPTAKSSVLRPGTATSVPAPFQFDALAKRGIHFAICGAAMGRLTASAAGPKGDTAAVRAELEAALPLNSHVMPSGIVAVQRAQELGYSYVHTS